MLTEFVNRLIALAVPNMVKTEDGREYADRKLESLEPPNVAGLYLGSLTGLVDYVKEFAKPDIGEAVPLAFHVITHSRVQLITDLDATWKKRQTILVAEAPAFGFAFGQFQDPEQFTIGLLANFSEKGQRAELQKLISSIQVGGTRTATDDGVSQVVATRQGIHLQGDAKLPNPVKLAALRSFPEIDPEPTSFVFRARDRDGATPQLALFDADGGKWQLEARKAIKAWLKEQLPEIPVIS